ncbi:MAG TPA: hypothetical protein VGO80_16785 [Solirubrobacteraceae bacterium]|nr:hypothetical protein [Solirubrobacteraceae bacterium]
MTRGAQPAALRSVVRATSWTSSREPSAECRIGRSPRSAAKHDRLHADLDAWEDVSRDTELELAQ